MPESKYPVTYWSTSKKAALNIEDMPTPHICNALRRLGPAAAQDSQVLVHTMSQELLSRGCVWNAETGRWDLPPKEPEAEVAS